MKTTHLIPLAFLVTALAATGFAAESDDHSVHHPAASVSAAAPRAQAPKPSVEMGWMDAQIDAMKAMHEKMVAARTPQERDALMGEHVKTMGAGMAMIKDMPREMADSKGAQGMAQRHAMMEKHMAMMGAAMEMMSDRLPQPAR